MTDTKLGSVKFYSSQKGFGFIFDDEGAGDLFFHITGVKGAVAPSTGNRVSYLVVDDKKSGRKKAERIQILTGSARNPTRTSAGSSPEGFPCVRSGAISGFVVQENLGSVSVGRPILRWSRAYSSVGEARIALIEEAKRLGGNAIVNYAWHNDRRRKERVLSKSWYFEDNFWAEGDAVVLRRT